MVDKCMHKGLVKLVSLQRASFPQGKGHLGAIEPEMENRTGKNH